MLYSTVDLMEQTHRLSTHLWVASRDGDRHATEAAALREAARTVSMVADDLFNGLLHLGKYAPEHAGYDPQHAPTP